MRAGLWSVVIGCCWLFVGCGKKAPDARQMFVQADTLVQKGKYQDALGLLEKVTETFPADTIVLCEALRMQADIQAGYIQNFNAAIASYTQILNRFPNTPHAATSLFKIAFTYETQLHDLTKAKSSYEEFIRRFPDHEMVPAARFSLENLGKSEDDIIEQLSKKAAANP